MNKNMFSKTACCVRNNLVLVNTVTELKETICSFEYKNCGDLWKQKSSVHLCRVSLLKSHCLHRKGYDLNAGNGSRLFLKCITSSPNENE